MKTPSPFEEGLCGIEVEIFQASVDDINLGSHLLQLEHKISKQPATPAIAAITATTTTATTKRRQTTASPSTPHPEICSATNPPIMSTPRSGGSVSSRGSSSRHQESSRSSTRQLIDSLNTHRINTLTELCRIERIAAACDSEADARAFQQPMTSAWIHYVTSNQFLMELRGLTRNYPLSADIVAEAHRRVRSDPESNRSWNLAWLCLTRMRDDGLVRIFSDTEARKPEMWGGKVPSEKMVQQLATCFEDEWRTAIETMLRHWTSQPTWY